VRNPVAAVKPPRVEKREMIPLPRPGQGLLDTAHEVDDRWSALYVLTVTTNLRQGKLLGLS
jgi:hypothetical protein